MNEYIIKTLEKMSKEGDYKEFIHKGFKCVIKRHPDIGHLCGYVGLPMNHKYYKKHYDDIGIDVHGGLTFSDFLLEDGLWYIGFDCIHSGDMGPLSYVKYPEMYNDERISIIKEEYRDLEYVENEIKGMVDQLIEEN